MSSYDDPSGWKPLIPAELDKYDHEVTGEPDKDDPEIAKAFKSLYDRKEEGELKKFSLLYGPKEELAKESIEEEERQAEPEETEEDENLPVEDALPELPDVEAIEKQAYAEGFAKGEKAGYEAGLKMAGEKTERLSSLVTDVDGMWHKIVKLYEKQIIELVGKVAEKVVYGRVAVDNEIITRAILDAFEQISDPVSATITVHPDDYDYIEIVKEDFFEQIQGLKQVAIVSDPLIPIGGCRIETSSGEVTTNIEERLEAVKNCIIDMASG